MKDTFLEYAVTLGKFKSSNLKNVFDQIALAVQNNVLKFSLIETTDKRPYI